jgi:hypothetical protein
LALIERGEIFGFEDMIENFPRSHQAKSVAGDSKIYMITKEVK